MSSITRAENSSFWNPEFLLEASVDIDAPVDEVFAFFSNAENLGAITPKSLHFQILSRLPIEMRAGAIIDYRIRLMGVPMQWRTEITVWEPNRRFIDSQRRGPYKLWEHEHLLEPSGSGARMIDRVRYALPFGPVGAFAHALFVRRQIEAIFRHRNAEILHRFPRTR